jgi:hypothetical protein
MRCRWRSEPTPLPTAGRRVLLAGHRADGQARHAVLREPQDERGCPSGALRPRLRTGPQDERGVLREPFDPGSGQALRMSGTTVRTGALTHAGYLPIGQPNTKEVTMPTAARLIIATVAPPRRLDMRPLRWWGPNGLTAPVCKIDFRPGERHALLHAIARGSGHPVQRQNR